MMTPARLEEIRAQAGVGGMTWHDRITLKGGPIPFDRRGK